VGDHISFTVQAQDRVFVFWKPSAPFVSQSLKKAAANSAMPSVDLLSAPPAGTCSRTVTSVMTRSKGRRSALVGPLTKP
jgi:hypothetical protein